MIMLSNSMPLPTFDANPTADFSSYIDRIATPFQFGQEHKAVTLGTTDDTTMHRTTVPQVPPCFFHSCTTWLHPQRSKPQSATLGPALSRFVLSNGSIACN